MGFVALWVRLSVAETDAFMKTVATRQSRPHPFVMIMREHRRAALRVIGIAMAGNLSIYLWLVLFPPFAHMRTGLPLRDGFSASVISIVASLIAIPLIGKLSDRIGRRNNMLLFGALGALATVPILTALKTVASPFVAGGLIIVALAIVSFYTSISGIVKAEMFPTEVRALGVGLAYAVANALFGGSAEYVALGLKTIGHESAFYWYVTAMMVVAFLVSLRLPRQARYLHLDH